MSGKIHEVVAGGGHSGMSSSMVVIQWARIVRPAETEKICR